MFTFRRIYLTLHLTTFTFAGMSSNMQSKADEDLMTPAIDAFTPSRHSSGQWHLLTGEQYRRFSLTGCRNHRL